MVMYVKKKRNILSDLQKALRTNDQDLLKIKKMQKSFALHYLYNYIFSAWVSSQHSC